MRMRDRRDSLMIDHYFRFLFSQDQRPVLPEIAFASSIVWKLMKKRREHESIIPDPEYPAVVNWMYLTSSHFVITVHCNYENPLGNHYEKSRA